MLVVKAVIKKENRLIEVIATDIVGLTTMGFGSVKNCRSVYNALVEKYSHVNFNVVRTKSDLGRIISRKPDLVFTGVKYVIFNELEATKNIKNKVWISEYMENAGINYTGSRRDAIELEISKDSAKKRVKEFGVDTAPYFVAKPGMYKSADELPVDFPLFIKPLLEGDSRGISNNSIVSDFRSYQNKVQNIYTLFGQAALIEKFLCGREFTVSVIDSDSSYEPIAMPVEIIVSDKSTGKKILGYEIKKDNRETVIAVDDVDIYESVVLVAKGAFVALGARDYGRIDIMMDENDSPHFLEANLVPGMTQRPDYVGCSYFPRACFINYNITYQETVHKIAEIALNRRGSGLARLRAKASA